MLKIFRFKLKLYKAKSYTSKTLREFDAKIEVLMVSWCFKLLLKFICCYHCRNKLLSIDWNLYVR